MEGSQTARMHGSRAQDMVSRPFLSEHNGRNAAQPLINKELSVLLNPTEGLLSDLAGQAAEFQSKRDSFLPGEGMGPGFRGKASDKVPPSPLFFYPEQPEPDKTCPYCGGRALTPGSLCPLCQIDEFLTIDWNPYLAMELT